MAKEAIEKFPEDSEHYGSAGDACKEMGRYEDAYWYWEKLHELDPDKLDCLYGIAFCREKLGEYEKAYEAWMFIKKLASDIGVKRECNMFFISISCSRGGVCVLLHQSATFHSHGEHGALLRASRGSLA